jgi:hypothetical protein
MLHGYLLWLPHVRPAFASRNPANCGRAHAENLAYILVVEIISDHLAHCPDRLFVEFGSAAVLPHNLSSMPLFIGYVGDVSVVPQIREVIVCTITIVVTNFHTSRSRPEKRLRNKNGNAKGLVFPATP